MMFKNFSLCHVVTKTIYTWNENEMIQHKSHVSSPHYNLHTHKKESSSMATQAYRDMISVSFPFQEGDTWMRREEKNCSVTQ